MKHYILHGRIGHLVLFWDKHSSSSPELELQSQMSARRGQHLADSRLLFTEHTDQTRSTMTKDSPVPDADLSNQVHMNQRTPETPPTFTDRSSSRASVTAAMEGMEVFRRRDAS